MSEFETQTIAKGPIAWMAGNSVAANLLMLVFIIGGLFIALQIKQEVFPEIELDRVVVSVAYPGASPEEVEKSIVQAIEERVQGIDGVDEVTSVAREGSGTVSIELLVGANVQKAGQDIQSEVDRITTFPEDAEEPQVVIESRRRDVLSLMIYGDASESVLREIAEQVRDGLLQSEDITQVELDGVRPREISIDVPRATLRIYNLTLEAIAAKIRRAAIELPGGGIKTKGGEILLRVKERRDFGREFEALPIISRPNGSRVLLGDIATIRDGFEDIDLFASYDGKPAVQLEVYRVGEQTPIQVSEAVRRYISDHKHEVPPGIRMAVWNDRSEIYRQRIQLLLHNGYLGLILVFLLLAVFLETRLAFWVTMGIPTSFLGAFLFLPMLGVSINMVSLFAFIIALGIVVDDAIVVGENIYEYHQRGESFSIAAVKGTRDVALPVNFSILTNIAAFMPLFFIPGMMGKIFKVIPAVVVTVFSISLVESLFVLPSHLGHQRDRERHGISGWLHGKQKRFSNWFSGAIRRWYGPFLDAALHHRYLSVAIGVGVLLITLAYMGSGQMGMTMFPKVESDEAVVTATLPYGSAVELTIGVKDRLVKAAQEVIARHGGTNMARGIYADVGTRGGHVTRVRVLLAAPEQRPIGTTAFVAEWRAATGIIPGLESLAFQSDFGGPGSGAALTIELSHRDISMLERAAGELAEALTEYPNVKDIDDGFTPGKRQYDFTLLPAGQSLGLTATDVARQVRSSFYGIEALRQQRGRDEIKVMVRLPKEQRISEYDLDQLLIRTTGGGEIPLRETVSIDRGRAYTELNRRNGRRVLSVTADVDPPSQAGTILESTVADTLPGLVERYPGLQYSFEGKQADMKESMSSLWIGFILAMFVVYAMLAIPLRSYVLPLLIMIAIPFGIVGAVLGHILMGYSLSIISMMGIVALSGVVVNDSLVLIEYANRLYNSGLSSLESVHTSGVRRFRPIMLTTLTTFGGLAPMIFETSRQARFLVPMAISLGFGILFATFISLVLVPCLFLVSEDIRCQLGFEIRRQSPEDIHSIAD